MPSMKELAELSNQVLDSEEEMRPEELALLAQDAISPGMGDGLVQMPSKETPWGITIEEMESAGWVTVWDKFTGEPSKVNRNMLAAQLLKVNDDGVRCFTTVKPAIEPWRGSTLCMLHPDSEDRSAYDRMGLPVCKSGNLASEFQMRLHMQHRHKNEWAQLQDIEQQKVDEEERLVRQALIRANTPTEDLLVPVAAVNEAAPPIEVAAPVEEEEEVVPETFVIEAEVEPEPVKVEPERVKVEEILSECLFCEKPMKGRTVKQKNRNTRLHMSSAHPEMEVTV
jgi:hypothetical protein|tara:strand:+ start:4924 stop:5769 length:846 start_codon:yes stop_codon:yes gene_type:complete